MSHQGKISTVLGAVFFALSMVLTTGCAKEAAVAPATAQPYMKYAPTGTNWNDTIVSGNSAKGISPITDDGDDMGDRERSSKPKP